MQHHFWKIFPTRTFLQRQRASTRTDWKVLSSCDARCMSNGRKQRVMQMYTTEVPCEDHYFLRPPCYYKHEARHDIRVKQYPRPKCIFSRFGNHFSGWQGLTRIVTTCTMRPLHSKPNLIQQSSYYPQARPKGIIQFTLGTSRI